MIELEGFMHDKSLDLDMQYYHIELPPGAKQLCTSVLPWGNDGFQKLLMGF